MLFLAQCLETNIAVLNGVRLSVLHRHFLSKGSNMLRWVQPSIIHHGCLALITEVLLADAIALCLAPEEGAVCKCVLVQLVQRFD